MAGCQSVRSVPRVSTALKDAAVLLSVLLGISVLQELATRWENVLLELGGSKFRCYLVIFIPLVNLLSHSFIAYSFLVIMRARDMLSPMN